MNFNVILNAVLARRGNIILVGCQYIVSVSTVGELKGVMRASVALRLGMLYV